MREFCEQIKNLYPFRAGDISPLSTVPEQPVCNENHPNYHVVYLHKFLPSENRKISGWSGRVFQVLVVDPSGTPIPGGRLDFVIAYQDGLASERPDVWGLTGQDGWVEYVHPKVISYWKIIVDGLWVVDKLWANQELTYHNPAPWPPSSGGVYGWRPVEEQGDGSYRITLERKY